MKKFQFCVYNSFTDLPFAGNPAAVFLNAEKIPEGLLQPLARQLNLVETVFVSQSAAADKRLRYFTPTKELPIAGHPTIAALFALQNKLGITEEPINFETKAGNITCWFSNAMAWMQQPAPTVKPVPCSPSEITKLFGVQESDIDNSYPFEICDTGLGHFIVPLRSGEALQSAQMNLSALSGFCQTYKAREAQLFAFDKDRIMTRNLCPRHGEEDPACGSGNAALGVWLARHDYLEIGHIIQAVQGHNINRPSEIFIQRLADREGRIAIAIGGRALKMIEGEVFAAI